MYNNLLSLSRNIFFYKKLGLPDTFETRIYLIFFHFSILLILFTKKKIKFSQKSYNSLFNNIENNLREMGYGDVAVNKKMKDLNRILYDILLKLDKKMLEKTLKLNEKVIFKYFEDLKDDKNSKYDLFIKYFEKFYQFCFEQSNDNMIEELNKFKY